jgi:hypothetical protein
MWAVFVQKAKTKRMRGMANRIVKLAQGLAQQPGHMQHRRIHLPAKVRVWLRGTMHVQEATMNRSGGEALSGMSNGRRASRNSLDTRNMAQFIALQPSRGIDYDKTAEEVLAKVRIVMALPDISLTISSLQPAGPAGLPHGDFHQNSCLGMMICKCIQRARDGH